MKKDGSLRFCIEYRPLSSIPIRDAYPIPRMDDYLNSIGGAKAFSTLDCISGYSQVPIAPQDRDKTTFISHEGLFVLKRMPFKLNNAPGTF